MTTATTSKPSFDVRKFLLSLLVDLAADKNYKPCFKGAHREVQVFFWKLKQNEQTKAFVDDLLFDTNGNYPHCEQIDELLQEFQLAGLLSRPNPTYKYNDIAVIDSECTRDFKDRILPQHEQAYTDALNAFKQDLGVPEL